MERTYLVKFEADYADEFDVYGFRVMNESQFQEFTANLEKIKFPQEVYFGTNEAVEFESLDEYKRAFKSKEIDRNEHLVLKRLFGNDWYGTVDFGHFLQIEDY